MKKMVCLIVVILSSIAAFAQSTEFSDAITKSDFVGFAIVVSSTNEQTVMGVTECFKGYAKTLFIKAGKGEIDPAHEYLVMAKMNVYHVSAMIYPLTPKRNLSTEKLAALDNMPCYIQVIEKDSERGACTRQYNPVCGCNNVTYGNTCEMSKDGIVRFKPGKCFSDKPSYSLRFLKAVLTGSSDKKDVMLLFYATPNNDKMDWSPVLSMKITYSLNKGPEKTIDVLKKENNATITVYDGSLTEKKPELYEMIKEKLRYIRSDDFLILAFNLRDISSETIEQMTFTYGLWEKNDQDMRVERKYQFGVDTP